MKGEIVVLKTPEQIKARLRKRDPDIRWRGERVSDPTEHPAFVPTALSWADWLYRAAFVDELRDSMVAPDDLNGEDCHIFWHMATDRAHLLQNLHAARDLARRSPLTGYASIGRDQLQALLIVSKNVDRRCGTALHSRVLAYAKEFQRQQWMVAAAVTDVKGNRMLRPSEQDDPDLYLRVVDRNADGIIVRGAKAHTSGSVIADELLVIPTRAMSSEADAAYAVAFAIPVDAPGITLVARTHNFTTDSAFEAPISSHDELAETLTLFNDVFVPYERVFLDGQWEVAGDLANHFASINRQGYLGTECGKLGLFIGAAERISQLNGTSKVGHIRDKITQLIRLERQIWAFGIAASVESTNIEGYQVPDPVLTNAGKLACMEGHYTATRLLLEIAGGLAATAPLLEDLEAPDIRPFVEKYLRGAEPGTAWERLRVLKLIRDLAGSEYTGYWNAEIIHGSGSPAAEMLQMYRETDLDEFGAMVDMALLGRDSLLVGATSADVADVALSSAAATAP